MISTVLPATIKGLKGGASLSSRCTATLSSSMTQPNGQDSKYDNDLDSRARVKRSKQ